MNFLPIVHRELRLTARKSATYYSRILAALIAALVELGMVFAGFAGMLSPNAAGRGAFHFLVGLGYVFVLCEGALLTCDCISQERREGTLGLLFLTNLRGYDIVLGKLVIHIGRSLQGLLAAAPALGFSIFLGGVSGGDLVAAACGLLNALFFSASCGLLISTLCREQRGAASFALAVASSFGLVLPSIGVATAAAGTWVHAWLLGIGPGGALAVALDPVSNPKSLLIWSLLSTQALAWTALVLASCRVPVLETLQAQRHSVAVPPVRDQGIVNSLAKVCSAFSPHSRDRYKEPVLNELDPRPPALALVGRTNRETVRSLIWFVAGTVLVLAIFALGTLPAARPGSLMFKPWLWVSVVIASPRRWLNPATFALLAFALHSALKYMAAEGACRALLEKRRGGELEMLLTTPLDEQDIVDGFLRRLRQRLFWPLAYVLSLDAVMLLTGWWQLGFFDGLLWVGGCLLELGWLAGNLCALSWVGLWLGMKSAAYSQALRRTIIYVCILPWLGLLAAAAIVAIASAGRANFSNLGPGLPLCFVVLLAVCNLGFSGWAVCALRDDLRAMVAGQFQSAMRASR